MTLESQVCSLDLAKRLKELGVKQESEFWWVQVWSTTPTDLDGRWRVEFGASRMPPSGSLSAFTVAELIEELQRVAKQDIIVASDNHNVADWLAEKLIEFYAQSSKIQG